MFIWQVNVAVFSSLGNITLSIEKTNDNNKAIENKQINSLMSLKKKTFE